MDTLGFRQRALEFAHGDVRILFDEFEEKATEWTKLARSRRTSAFGGGERLAAPHLAREPRARRRGDHQTSGGFTTAEAGLDSLSKPTAKVLRKWCGHGVILLKRMNHNNPLKGIPRFNVGAGRFSFGEFPPGESDFPLLAGNKVNSPPAISLGNNEKIWL